MGRVLHPGHGLIVRAWGVSIRSRYIRFFRETTFSLCDARSAASCMSQPLGT